MPKTLFMQEAKISFHGRTFHTCFKTRVVFELVWTNKEYVVGMLVCSTECRLLVQRILKRKQRVIISTTHVFTRAHCFPESTSFTFWICCVLNNDLRRVLNILYLYSQQRRSKVPETLITDQWSVFFPCSFQWCYPSPPPPPPPPCPSPPSSSWWAWPSPSWLRPSPLGHSHRPSWEKVSEVALQCFLTPLSPPKV